MVPDAAGSRPTYWYGTLIVVHQASRDDAHGGMVTDPTRIGRRPAEPTAVGRAALPDSTADRGIVATPGRAALPAKASPAAANGRATAATTAIRRIQSEYCDTGMAPHRRAQPARCQYRRLLPAAQKPMADPF
jgi:hypothetical protein